MLYLASSLTFLATLPLLSAHPSHNVIRGAPLVGKRECGTVATQQNIEDIAKLADGIDLPNNITDRLGPSQLFVRAPVVGDTHLGNITIDTYVHIIAQSKALGDGWITDAQVNVQLEEMNRNFARQKITFELKGITRTINEWWAWDFDEIAMKSALRKGDYKSLNIYIQPQLYALGYAHFPEDVEKGSEKFIRDGINLLTDSLPGEPIPGYDLGRTATHEIGHWLGLFHTFQGFSCDDPTGDYIADTPTQAYYTTGCPTKRDTCPGLPGLDPITNYMDYSTDDCYEEFTPLQTKRMHDAYHRYRSPRVCHADDCLRAFRASTVQGRLEESLEFCKEYTVSLVTEVTEMKAYAVSACQKGGGDVVSRVSSACSCLPSLVGDLGGLPFPE